MQYMKYMTTKEIAELFKVTPRTATRLMQEAQVQPKMGKDERTGRPHYLYPAYRVVAVHKARGGKAPKEAKHVQQVKPNSVMYRPWTPEAQ